MNLQNFKSIYKLLIGRHKKFSIFGALFGLLIGCLILFIVIQLYFDVKSSFIEDEGLISEDYLVINKRISILNTLNIPNKGFSESEIQSIKNQEFITEVGAFIPNEFRVSAYTKAKETIPAFYTELFFEGVHSKFLDVDTNEWIWDENNKIVPIIIPRNYLKLYNFGFAQSQNLPQLSEGIIGRFSFNLKIEGNSNSIELHGKIYGFSDRINSILVPLDFIKWGNENFSNKAESPQAGRLILKSNQKYADKLIAYLDENQYETSEPKLKSSKLQFLLKSGVYAISFISLIIIFLAFLSFILSFNIIVIKSEKSIKTLINLGFKLNSLSNFYNLIYLISLSLSVSLSLLIVAIIKSNYVQYFSNFGFNIDSGLNPAVYIIGISIILLLFVFNFFNLKANISKINKSLI